MENDVYSIKEMLEEFRKDVNGRFDKVDVAQAHTNGDVGSLKLWRSFIMGGLVIITMLVIPLVVYVWNQKNQFQTQNEQLQSLSKINQQYDQINQNH